MIAVRQLYWIPDFCFTLRVEVELPISQVGFGVFTLVTVEVLSAPLNKAPKSSYLYRTLSTLGFSGKIVVCLFWTSSEIQQSVRAYTWSHKSDHY